MIEWFLLDCGLDVKLGLSCLISVVSVVGGVLCGGSFNMLNFEFGWCVCCWFS